MSKSIKYVSIGAVKGLTREVHGVKFKDGVAEVSEEYHKNSGHVLRDHYSAVPEAEAAEAQAAWQKGQDEVAAAAKAREEAEAEKLRKAVQKATGEADDEGEAEKGKGKGKGGK